MTRAPIGLLIVALLTLSSCASEHTEEPGVVEALDATVAALQQSDWDALWALTDADSQTALLTLVRELHDALKRVPAVYGEQGDARVAAARAALGESLVDTIFPDEDRAGPRLLERVLSPEALRFDSHAMDGVNHHEITLDASHDPVKAIVHTNAGETFAFTKTDAGWRSLLVRDVILDSATFRTLADNVDKLAQAAQAKRDAWRRTRDPRTPQGAYNIARAAQGEQPANAKLLYSLLDSEAHAVVIDALERSRQVQRGVQRKTTRRQRPKAYEDAGLTMYVSAKSDLELYARWARTEGWKAPLAATDAPERIAGDPASGRVQVVTASGVEIPMRRGDDGTWRIADQAPILKKALRDPFDEEAP